MIFRQLFERESSTYTYLLGDEATSKALLIDPVLSQVGQYINLLEELGLQLAVAVDTHVHADHITGLGLLREQTGCRTLMGVQSHVDCINETFSDGDQLTCGNLALEVIYTPGHTDDSYSFLLRDGDQHYLFSGDTLLIRGTGRTDFQNGDSGAQYHSLFDRLLQLPDSTRVYPAHDYRGMTVSTIGEEKRFNPRLQMPNEAAYRELMASLKLPTPQQMDVAVPANRQCGKAAQ